MKAVTTSYYSILFKGYSWFHPYDTGSYFKTRNKFTSHSTQYNWLYFILILSLVVPLLFENESQSVAMACLNILILQTLEYWHYSLYRLTCLCHDLCSLICYFFCILGTHWPLLLIRLFSSSQYPRREDSCCCFPALLIVSKSGIVWACINAWVKMWMRFFSFPSF